MDIYELTMKEATKPIIEKIQKKYGYNQKDAMTLFKNALRYNVCIDEIMNQIDFILSQVKKEVEK